MARFGFSDRFTVDSGGGRGGYQFQSKINTTPPPILMRGKWRVGLAANSPLILGEGWFGFLFYSGQDCSVASGCFSLVDSTQIKSYRNSKNAVDITHQKNRDCVDQLLAYLFKSHNHLFRD